MEEQNQPTEQTRPTIANSSSPSKAFLILLGLIILAAVSTGAYFLGIKNAQPNPQPAIVPIVAKPTPTPDPTANWKTYINSQYGFSFKYPTGWGLYEGTDSINIQDSTDLRHTTPNNYLYIRINRGPPYKMVNPTDGQLIDAIYKYWTYSTSGLGDYDPVEIGQESIQVDGKKAVRYSIKLKNPKRLQYSQVYRIYIKHKDIVYEFDLDGKNQYLLQQILSTFTFTNQNSVVTPTCMQRPACLDTAPRCLMPEPANGWCPSSTATQ